MPLDNPNALPVSAPPIDERRTFGRRMTFQPARIIREGCPPAACFIVDISEGGARIRLPQPDGDYTTFELEIESQGISVSCIVVHRQPNHIGVRFARIPRQLARPAPGAPGRLKNLLDAMVATSHLPR